MRIGDRLCGKVYGSQPPLESNRRSPKMAVRFVRLIHSRNRITDYEQHSDEHRKPNASQTRNMDKAPYPLRRNLQTRCSRRPCAFARAAYDGLTLWLKRNGPREAPRLCRNSTASREPAASKTTSIGNGRAVDFLLANYG